MAGVPGWRIAGPGAAGRGVAVPAVGVDRFIRAASPWVTPRVAVVGATAGVCTAWNWVPAGTGWLLRETGWEPVIAVAGTTVEALRLTNWWPGWL